MKFTFHADYIYSINIYVFTQCSKMIYGSQAYRLKNYFYIYNLPKIFVLEKAEKLIRVYSVKKKYAGFIFEFFHRVKF